MDKSRATINSIIPGFCLVGLPHEERVTKTLDIWRARKKDERLLKEAILGSKRYLKEQLGLFEIARLRGACTDYIEKPGDAEKVYSNTFTIINNRYVIGYYPTNEEKNEKRRNVKIEVRGHPEYIVTGRKSSFASSGSKQK